MTTENTRIDYERIDDIILPSVTEAVTESFGVDFCAADLDQGLVLLEALAFTLRNGGSFRENLVTAASWGSCLVALPEIPTTTALQVNEGLKLIGMLQATIVEGYSVLAASERLPT